MVTDFFDCSFLVIDQLDDYIFTYDVFFENYFPFSKIDYIRELNEFKSILKSNSSYDFVICELYFMNKCLNDYNSVQNFSHIGKNIIFTSAYDLKYSCVGNFIKYGYSFIEKPFDFNTLRNKINSKISVNIS